MLSCSHPRLKVSVSCLLGFLGSLGWGVFHHFENQSVFGPGLLAHGGVGVARLSFRHWASSSAGVWGFSRFPQVSFSGSRSKPFRAVEALLG